MWLLIVVYLSGTPGDFGPFYGPYQTRDLCEEDSAVISRIDPSAEPRCVRFSSPGVLGGE